MAGPKPYDSRVSIQLPSDEDIRRTLGAEYDSEKTLNVIKMFAGTEDMCAPTLGLVRAVFAADGVDVRLRQAIILRAATMLDVPYEWQANVPMSRNNGISDEDIEIIGTRGSATVIPNPYALVCKATDEMCAEGTLTDSTLQALLDAQGEVTTRKIVLIIAWFNLLSLFLNGCRVPMETRDKIGAKKSPLE